MAISTSSWRPGDAGRDALIEGTLEFTLKGCPELGPRAGIVWPAGYTSIVNPNGNQFVITADGQQIAAGDIVLAGGAAAVTEAGPGMPCIKPGTKLTFIESTVKVIPGD